MKSWQYTIVVLFKIVVVVALIFVWIWGVVALFLNTPGPMAIKYCVSIVFAVLLPAVFIYSRSFIRGTVLSLCVFGVLLFWWQTLTPSNDKDWAPDVAKISHGEIRGDILTMFNVRNFEYKSEQLYYQHWDTRTYNFNNLEGVDIFLSYWASEHIAHTILSWDFGEDGHLPISIETRKDKSQEYSSVKGFFKQFEIAYIAADEKDIIRLRTNYRKERVYLYRLKASKQQILALLKDYLVKMNSLVNKPQFYNALSHNCTTTIQIHANAIREDAPPPIDWRLIASGHVDELLYDRGVIQTDVPFAELRKASRVDLSMQQEGKEDFSSRMREHIKIALKTN
ncbi:MAG: hypothetical protein ACI8ZB_001580 [Desulforhopalus sp.]|jgi:hypothetical protein